MLRCSLSRRTLGSAERRRSWQETTTGGRAQFTRTLRPEGQQPAPRRKGFACRGIADTRKPRRTIVLDSNFNVAVRPRDQAYEADTSRVRSAPISYCVHHSTAVTLFYRSDTAKRDPPFAAGASLGRRQQTKPIRGTSLYRNSHTLFEKYGKLSDVPDISRRLYLALDHLEFDGLAGLANVLGKDRAFFDALEYLLGFLAIRGRGVAHEGDGIMHFGGHRLAFFRRADQLCSHGFDFPGSSFVVAYHGLGSKRADARDAFFMLDVVRHRPRWCCLDRGKTPDDVFFKLG